MPTGSRAWKRRYPSKLVRSAQDTSPPTDSIRPAIAVSSSEESTSSADLEATATSDVAIATAVLAEEQERLGV